MEEILLHNLTSRYQVLKETELQAESVLSADIIILEDLINKQISLRNSLDHFATELNYCIRQLNSPDTELFKRYFDDKLKFENLLTRIETVVKLHSSENTFDMSNRITQSRLPKLELAKFNGNLLHWNSYWDQFEANVHNKNISDAEKLSYLLGSLEGTARQAIEGLGTTNQNYMIAVDILKSRFGKSDRVVDAHNEALQKLTKAQYSGAHCRLTLNHIETHLRILESMGENVDSSHLRVIILSKFPDNILYQVNLITAKDSSILSLRKALDTVIMALECSEGIKGSEGREANSEITETSSVEALCAKTESKPPVRKRFSQRSNKSRPIKRSFQPSKQSEDGKQKGFEKVPGPAPKKRKILMCIFCNGQHFNDECRQFLTENSRKECLKGKCFLCFRPGHCAKNCTVRVICHHCKQPHNRALCPDRLKGKKGLLASNTPSNKIENFDCLSTHTKSYLQTATATIKNQDNEEKCRLVLDSGSQKSYMTTRLANKLKLKYDKEDYLIIYSFGSEVPNKILSPTAEVELLTKRGIRKKIQVNIVPHITHRVPVPALTTSKFIDVTADDFSVGETVDLLIGNDYYFSFMRNEITQLDDNFYLVNTDFGWIISGKLVSEESEDELSVITYCQCHGPECEYFTQPDLPLRNIDMRFLWSLESIGITDSPKTTREEEAVRHYNETVRYENKRYEVKWPWIEYPPELPSNYGLAYGRLKGLLKRLDADTIKDYSSILQEQLQAGIIEIIDPKQTNEEAPIHYIPHHIVKQPGKRGRIVYDASAKVKGYKSLNECLYKGPSMLEDMTALLLKFRIGKIGIVADVEKAFLQVGLQEPDREVTRFLWVKDPTKQLTTDNLIHMRFCRVPFGIISSPFLLTATIRYHLSKVNKNLLTEIAERCYVDNLVTTANSVEEATELYNAVRQVFGELSMNIRDWTSNSTQFLKGVPDTHRAKDQKRIKVLGLMWDREDDTLHLKTENIFENEETVMAVNSKREVLKMLARLYDPCGFIAPLILPAKLLFQQICIDKLKWDTPLSPELKVKWRAVVEGLREASTVQIPRHAGENTEHKDTHVQLHCFADASQHAYAAVIYLRISKKKGALVSFLMSKARITPEEDKDALKIPRLELLAFLIGNRLLNYVKTNLGLPIDRCFIWTDSLIVLHWLKTNKLLPPFVTRRINEIKQNKEVEYCYISSSQNPADLATRPELWQQKKNIWFNGPDFLSKDIQRWPKNMYLANHNISCLAGEGQDHVDGPEMIDKVYEETFDSTLNENSPYVTEPRETSVKAQSMTEKIRKLQLEHFPEEVSGKITHLTRNLGLFLDVDGLLRCKGRMTNADWTYDKKHPILLPPDCNFTYDMILETHVRHYHVGVSHTLSLLRHTYWVPKGRAQVQKVLKKCPQCVKYGGGPYKLPEVAPLPTERINFSAPFTFTGIDYFGPMFVCTETGKAKRWVCLYTCLAVRAVHLEVVNDLTAEECLLALRRFTASRGIPKLIISDNALQFKLLSEILSDPYCVKTGIKWKFIPQLAPWHGGFYERLVALVKHCLKRTLDKHLLRDPQLLTVLKEVESVVNTRPLTSVGAELENVLKPADFLSLGQCLEMDSSVTQTQGNTTTKVSLVEGWRRGQRLLEDFRRMFQDQYLPSLRERYSQSYKQSRVTSKRVPQVGDIVQIKDDSRHRQNWKVGKITSLLKGRDGECRVAKVKVGETEFTRSLGHLYPLEIDQEKTETMREPGGAIQEEPVRLMDLQQVDLGLPNERLVEENSVHEDKDSDLTADTPTGERADDLETGLEECVGAKAVSIPPEDQVPTDVTMDARQPSRSARSAAIRARERIAEWTRQLLSLLKL